MDGLVPKSQQDAMLQFLVESAQKAQSDVRSARTAAERARAMSDLEGVQIMQDRVMREWNVK